MSGSILSTLHWNMLAKRIIISAVKEKAVIGEIAALQAAAVDLCRSVTNPIDRPLSEKRFGMEEKWR